MNFNQLSIRFSLDDLNEFAPKHFKKVNGSKEPVPIAVKFVLNKNNIIEAVIQYYKDKYPNIDKSDNIFCTGHNLCRLELVIGESVIVDGVEIPVGFEGETVESVFNKKFNDPKSTGILSIKRLKNCGKLKEINMITQTADMDEYGEVCEKYYGAVDEIKSLEEEIEKLKINKPKSNFFGKQEKWFECFDKLSNKKGLLEQNKVGLEIKKNQIFIGLSFNPVYIFMYAYRLAAMKKIQMVLKNFEMHKKAGTAEKSRVMTPVKIGSLKLDNNSVKSLSPIISLVNSDVRTRSHGS